MGLASKMQVCIFVLDCDEIERGAEGMTRECANLSSNHTSVSHLNVCQAKQYLDGDKDWGAGHNTQECAGLVDASHAFLSNPAPNHVSMLTSAGAARSPGSAMVRLFICSHNCFNFSWFWTPTSGIHHTAAFHLILPGVPYQEFFMPD